jgi:hypothetical protein
LFGALPAAAPGGAASRALNHGMEYTETEVEQVEPKNAALPLVVLLALASALGVAVAIALAGVAMLLAAPAYAQEGRNPGLGDTAGSLVLERHGAMAEAERLSAEIESLEDGDVLVTRVVEVYHNPFREALTGFYLYRLPANVVLDRLSFAPEAAAARHALLTHRESGALVEPTEELGPGETLVVVLQYRTRGVRRVLAFR